MSEIDDTPIQVSKLSKRYSRQMGLLSVLHRSFSGESSTAGALALSDVSFHVKRGEAFGIIGRNGAGKSTLLQILAGTLRATEGTFTIKGRVTALLELGSGFNPDFTGRENIYLAGSILGIKREEMDAKFTRITDFADIGSYIDEPVRTYSTGMLMRVAFAVAISVEPDVLIIDEALSVGDILFQQKCNLRLKEMMQKGITLLVVTHDTGFVLSLCQRALWLHKGKPAFLGEAGACVRAYLAAMNAASEGELARFTPMVKSASLPLYPSLELETRKRLGDEVVCIEKVWVLGESGKPSQVFTIGDWCQVWMVLRATCKVSDVSGGIELRDRHGQVIFAGGMRAMRTLIDGMDVDARALVKVKFRCDLGVGQFTLDVGSSVGRAENDHWQRIPAAAVIEIGSDPSKDIVHGLVRLPYEVAASQL